MKKLIFLFTTCLFILQTHASNLIDGDVVSKQRDCFSGVFSDYASWRGLMHKKASHKSSGEALEKRMRAFDERFGQAAFDQFKSNLSCANFSYRVDGIEVRGFVIKPKHTEKDLPVLVYNRGGNGSFGSVVFGAMMANLFPVASEGFVIIGSQYRQSRNKQQLLDQFGGSDVNDVVALTNIIPHIKGADAERLGMFGASRGGMQTYMALQQIKGVKAVAVTAGVADLAKELQFRPEMEKVYRMRIPQYEQNKTAELDKRSVIKWIDQLPADVPYLLLHGKLDKRVSVENSVDLADAFTKAGIKHKLVVYSDDNHFFSVNKPAAVKELVSWFKAYLN